MEKKIHANNNIKFLQLIAMQATQRQKPNTNPKQML